jgi:predicted transcriptional regulator
MKLPSCPRTLIINILRKHPDGLTITSIAELAGMHRHTATKYVYELKGAGVINERDIGSAKLCYLREGLSRGEEKKVVERLNGNGNWKKSSSSMGQVQILTVFLFLFLVPAGIIIAQNATQNINSTGELILGQMNTSIDASADASQSISEMQNQTQNPAEFQSDASENAALQENATAENAAILNETITNEAIQNETNAPISLPENQIENTTPETYQTNIAIPEILQPALSVRISSPDKTLRGEDFDISAIVYNTGNSGARNVQMEWILPEEFEIVSGGLSANCGMLSSDSECTSSLTLSSPVSADIGKSEIKVIVKYEE